MPIKTGDLIFQSQPSSRNGATNLLTITPEVADWKLLYFNVRRLQEDQRASYSTGELERCLVLLEGQIEVKWHDGEAQLGPRASVFASYPHALYLPPGVDFEVRAIQPSEWADGGAKARKEFPARVIRPADCGFEIRGGGNATRQIIDIMPPNFAADRLLVCEVFTPAGNWSSYPPHKHDEDRPPREVKLEEVYYYRFKSPQAYGFQRVYSHAAGNSYDKTFKVTHGDLILIRNGYHPFVTAYGYDAYYLNYLAGDRRSMASSDDPEYSQFRESWPPADPRLPLLEHPARRERQSH